MSLIKTIKVHAISIIMTVFLVCNGWILALNLANQPWSPLEAIPTEQVISIRQIDSIPVFSFNESLKIIAKKCNKTSKDVAVYGNYSWVLDRAHEITVPMGETAGVRKANSCGPNGKDNKEYYEYHNTIPEQVISIAKMEIKVGRKAIFFLTGVETPVSISGENGAPIHWKSQVFQLVP